MPFRNKFDGWLCFDGKHRPENPSIQSGSDITDAPDQNRKPATATVRSRLQVPAKYDRLALLALNLVTLRFSLRILEWLAYGLTPVIH